jgi:8-oxo-dGTP pyrophosphatase MutT (NUDIX family)
MDQKTAQPPAAEARMDTPSRPEGARAVRPRHAATLIIVRRDGKTPHVLMGRRGSGHDFMPDKWVFPGGRIDRSDYRVPTASELRGEVAARLSEGTPAHKGRALALSAIRETFEEAGLLLAKPAPPRSVAGPWREFFAIGALPDLDALDVIARAVTPPSRFKRFDARFFVAEADRLLSLERRPDCGELDEIAWFDLDEALRLDLPDITRFVLRELGERIADPEHGHKRYMRFWRGRRFVEQPQ